jgi:predicted phosphoribosyltransferase
VDHPMSRELTFAIVAEIKFLDELVSDCIIYGLKEEALECIKSKFKEIKSRSYQQRKAKILSECSMRIWLCIYNTPSRI